MWEVLAKRPLGRLSMRNFLLFATTLLMAFLANLTLATQPSSAASDATWSGDQISYNSTTFTQDTGDQKRAAHAPSDAAAVYVYSNPQASHVQVIFFPKGSDPASSKTAQYYVEPDVKNAKSISIEPKADPPADNSSSNGTSSCSVSGIGWIICPVSNALASSVDYLYNIVAGFLRVEPLTADNSGVIYRGWSYMRNIANLAFVIAFLIIIYSQLTNAGISSYGIKKLLPRLVAAAILMNVSYWICAIAVDLSNITGYNLENMFIDLRHGMMGGANVEMPSWHEIAMTVLAGSGAIAVGAHVIGVSSGGAIALLAPILVGVALSALIAIIILAARQAIITVLIIISPLAFVAFLLPNTEKYFKKWRETITSLLIMFPIFAMLFGGAQLAGTAIVLTAHGSIVELIFGLAVQVIPLAITPLILKFSGSLLSQVAGVVNNPKRGVIDRSRNWAKGVNERQTARGIAAGNKYARYHDHRRREREKRHELVKSRNDNIWNETKRAEALHEAEHDIERAKKRIEAEHEIHINAKIRTDKHEFEKEMRALNAQDGAELAKARVESMRSEYKSGYRDPSLYPHGPQQDPESYRLQDAAVQTAQDIALTGIRKSQAEHELSSGINKNLLSNQVLQKYATGIGDHELMLAGVVAKDRKEYAEHVAAQEQLMKHFKVESNDYQELAMSRAAVTKRDAGGNEHTFSFNNEYTKEAAIENQFKAGSYNQKMEIIEESGQNVMLPNGATRVGVNYDHRSTIQSAAIASGFSSAAPFVNDKTYDAILKGEFNGVNSTAEHAVRQIFEGRLKAENLSKSNAKALRIIYGVQNPGAEFSDPAESNVRDAIIRARDEFMRTHNQSEIQTFQNYYDGLLGEATKILGTPTIAQNTNAESKAVLERYRS